MVEQCVFYAIFTFIKMCNFGVHAAYSCYINMKTLINIAFILVVSAACGQSKEVKTAQFKVWGNCEMCKKTIENSLDVKGVKSAKWNQETKMITVKYVADKISEDDLHKKIASAGYDTEKESANDEVYKNLPDCCQYTRKQ